MSKNIAIFGIACKLKKSRIKKKKEFTLTNSRTSKPFEIQTWDWSRMKKKSSKLT